MPAILVEAVRTTYNKYDLTKGFIIAWKELLGDFPKKESLYALLAQNALETGLTRSMWNNNIGNVKFVPSKNQDDDNDKQYMMLANVWEILHGVKTVFQPPSQATWFRSFPTLKDGITDHLTFLKNKRFKNAWIAVENGDPVDFCHRLKLQSYYTAPEADYIKGVTSYFNQFKASNDYDKIIKELSEQVAEIPAHEPVDIEDDSPTEPFIPIVFFPDEPIVKPIENTDPIKLNWIQSLIEMIMKIISLITKKK